MRSLIAFVIGFLMMTVTLYTFGAYAQEGPPVLQAPVAPVQITIPCTPDGAAASAFVHEGYMEQDVAVAITSSGKAVVLSYNSAGQTWTIVSYAPDGSACLLASGKGPVEVIEPDAPPVPGQDG